MKEKKKNRVGGARAGAGAPKLTDRPKALGVILPVDQYDKLLRRAQEAEVPLRQLVRVILCGPGVPMRQWVDKPAVAKDALKVRVVVRIPTSQRKRLDLLASDLNTTLSDVVRQILQASIHSFEQEK